MKNPKDRNYPVDAKRIRQWVNNYAGYRHTVSDSSIRDWIAQFKKNDQDLAARILDCIDFYSHDQIAAAFKSILTGLDGWSNNVNERKGRWRFVAYSASAGESGDSMLHKFRHANNLAGQKYSELFIYRSDILREGLGFDDTVVLIDDFVGTGDQACDSWNNQFGELLAEVGRVYLVVVAACGKSIKRVSNETNMEIVPHWNLNDSDNIFSDKCKHFSTSDKKTLTEYCSRASHDNPSGKGDCGLLVVFAHSCPNDSIPILHKSNRSWEPLFRRYD